MSDKIGDRFQDKKGNWYELGMDPTGVYLRPYTMKGENGLVEAAAVVLGDVVITGAIVAVGWVIKKSAKGLWNIVRSRK